MAGLEKDLAERLAHEAGVDRADLLRRIDSRITHALIEQDDVEAEAWETVRAEVVEKK